MDFQHSSPAEEISKEQVVSKWLNGTVEPRRIFVLFLEAADKILKHFFFFFCLSLKSALYHQTEELMFCKLYYFVCAGSPQTRACQEVQWKLCQYLRGNTVFCGQRKHKQVLSLWEGEELGSGNLLPLLRFIQWLLGTKLPVLRTGTKL